MVDRQIMSDVNPSVPVEQVVTKNVASDNTAGLLSTILKGGVGMYATYQNNKAASLKDEAMQKAWEIAQKVRQAREAGQITPLEAKNNLSKALTGLTAQYGFGVQATMAETMGRAFKWSNVLKGTEVDKLAESFMAAGMPKSLAYAKAAENFSLKIAAENARNMETADPAFAEAQVWAKKIHATALELGISDQAAAAHLQHMARLKKENDLLKIEASIMEKQSKINSQQLSSVNVKATSLAIKGAYVGVIAPLLMKKDVSEEEKQQALQKIGKIFLNAQTQIIARANDLLAKGKITSEEADRQIKFTNSMFDTYKKKLEDLVSSRDINKAAMEEFKFSTAIDMAKNNPEVAKVATMFPGAFNGLMSELLKTEKAPNEATREAMKQQVYQGITAINSLMTGRQAGDTTPEGFEALLRTLNSPDIPEDEKTAIVKTTITKILDPSYDDRGDLLAGLIAKQSNFNEIYKHDPKTVSSFVDTEIDTFLRQNKELSIDASDIQYEIKNGRPVIYLIPKKDSMSNPLGYRMFGTTKVPLSQDDALSKIFLLLYRKSNAEGKPFSKVFDLYKNKLLKENK